MEKIRALAIAPYEGLRAMIENIADKRGDIEITAYLGNLELGADLVKRIDQSKYDVIISRGGTAKLIREVTRLPVIEITLSYYDILHCIKLAENYNGRFAIIGFPSISNFARVLCDILHLDIRVETINKTSETGSKLALLKRQGYTMVLSDTTAIDKAKEMGMTSMLITSNMESIESAVDQAVSLCKYYIGVINQNLFYNAALEAQGKRMIVYSVNNGAEQFLFSNVTDSEAGLLGAARKMLTQVEQNGNCELVQKVGKVYYHIKGFKAEVRKTAAIIFTAKVIETYKKPVLDGVQMMIKSEITTDFFDLMHSRRAELKRTVEQYGQSNKPALIVGEVGTGKDDVAKIIFRNSRLSNQILYTIDFLLLSDKGWHYLLEDPLSYFMDNNNTFYLKNLFMLREEKITKLFSFIENTKLDQRNRLIFSVQYNINEIRQLPFYDIIKRQTDCLTIHLPPLRECADDIPALVSFFLNESNGLSAKQISGCEPEGMRLLQEFEWEYNFNQFRRVLGNLAASATAPYITTDSIRAILKDESRSLQIDKSNIPGINIDRPLDEIIYEVVVEILRREKMNQTRAAKKLGISRTTLWRIINKK